MQRVRIGLTGLAFVFLAVMLAMVFTREPAGEMPITPNMLEPGRPPPPAPPPANPTEPLAELDYLAVCAIGAGRAFLVADADLLRDGLWAAPVARGTERHLRRADNPVVLADWLDRLAGVDRERAARPVFWRRPGANRAWSLLLAALPILAALGLAAALRRRRA